MEGMLKKLNKCSSCLPSQMVLFREKQGRGNLYFPSRFPQPCDQNRTGTGIIIKQGLFLAFNSAAWRFTKLYFSVPENVLLDLYRE